MGEFINITFSLNNDILNDNEEHYRDKSKNFQEIIHSKIFMLQYLKNAGFFALKKENGKMLIENLTNGYRRLLNYFFLEDDYNN